MTFTGIMQIADIAGAVVVPTMERRRRRKNFDTALKAHQASAGQFEDDGSPQIDGPHFDHDAMAERQQQIDMLKAKLGMK